MNSKPARVFVNTLGCSKNLVDSERLMRRLANVGFDVNHQWISTDGMPDIVIINTCGFIGDAKEESIEEILSWVPYRQEGKIKSLIVMGCLSERYRDELKIEIPEVDGWYGKTDWDKIVGFLTDNRPDVLPYDRLVTTPPHHAYLKIAEGCNRFCAFCAIPLITGRFRSRPVDEIIAEVKLLVSRGVKEFNVICQELTGYGKDLGNGLNIATLVDAIADVEGVEWIRLHYAYPADFPEELLDVMARRNNVCKYLDIALQHVSDPVLKNMRRHITSDETRRLLKTIRERVPGIHIRTTLMVGFPGEGDAEFDELKQFVKEQKFERMGAFAYCCEDDTIAARDFTDDIPDEVKQARLDELMAIQEEISLELQQMKIGQTIKVIIDREDDDWLVGRTEFDSPEVDPEVLIEKTAELKPGEMVEVKITDATAFDLFGRVDQM
ncbi:MAG: 30S ribosomal protein S12 methylthiotransferase RimO [Muribaculaceae bacterium]|nr:30S ribosomal protein S12 methylthiotransferase RimO [Muribaculaceae bacterium]